MASENEKELYTMITAVKGLVDLDHVSIKLIHDRCDLLADHAKEQMKINETLVGLIATQQVMIEKLQEKLEDK